MRVPLAVVLIVLSLLLAGPVQALDWAGKVANDRRDLKSPSPLVRLRALSRMGQYPDAEIIPLTLRMLQDVDARVQRAAAAIAGDRRLSQAVPILTQWLTHWDMDNRVAAAENLGRIGDTHAIKSLIRTLADPEIKVRLEVIKALGQLRSKNADEVIPLLGRLRDTSSKVRMAAVKVLAARSDRRAVIPLMGRLEDSAREVRVATIAALGELGDEKAGPSLVRLLRDPDAEIVAAAIKTLGALRFQGGVEPLIDLFKNGAARHRVEAASALASLGSPLSLQALAGSLQSPSLRAAAQAALVEAGPKAQTAIMELLRDPRTQRKIAIAAVEVARDARLRQTVPLLIEQVHVGKLPLLLLIQTLGRIADPGAQRCLLGLLDHRNLDVHMAALDALSNVIDERAAEPLVRLLTRDNRARSGPVPRPRGEAALACGADGARCDRQLRIKVLGYLGRLASRLATPRLQQLARSHDRVIARAATAALSQARDPRACPALVELLGHRDRIVRRIASQALGRIADLRALPPLLRLCRDSLGAIRVVCLQALGGVLRGKTDDRAFAMLKEMIASTDRSAFLAATDALAAMRDPRTAALLRQRYPTLTLDLQRKVVEVLGNDSASTLATRQFLVERLRGKGPPLLRSAAAWSLGKLEIAGDKDARRALMAAARDTDWMVRTNAVAALARATCATKGRGHLAMFRAMSTDAVPHVRANAVLGLGLCRDRSAIDLLLHGLLGDRSPWVRANALRALRMLQPTRGPTALQSRDRRRWTDVDHLTRTVIQEDVDARVRRIARRMLEPSAPPQGSWIGLYVLDQLHRPLRNAKVLLITPSGMVRAATSDGRAELWEENLSDGFCFSELPSPTLTQTSEN